ncbi:hypothetical protein BJF93_20650 [Xaviernesmea oryzae]|uniref:Antifreeze protein n=1 Tax=Xaviernesmea oryzae TaxID=464029 RepID=A0A1Q9AZR9_9HYPH|nr:hypothetical protein [Xaviernesmea oryzae]OLP61204.1 hypothetical protein BJF93_20650 [Xaviernesmea oryzae]SEL50241.1 hypothetical protein SAMN04487976_1096 [Xaviernesmea oryzae]
MTSKLATLALAGLVALSGLAAGQASAGNLSVGIYAGDITPVQYRDERDWRPGPPPGWRHDRGPDRGPNPGWRAERGGRCAPWMAEEKARAYGLRRARVVAVTPRRVIVEGRRFGEFRRISFANVRGCPSLR